MISKDQLLKIVNEIVGAPFENPREVAGYLFDNMQKRRPFLFTAIAHFKDDTFINTELFYLEPGEEPKDFVQRASKYIRNLYGEGCVISKQEIKL